MWNWILSDDSYTELYHQYFAAFLNTVDVQAIIDNAYNLIKSYVEKDPTAFYTYEEFEIGVETLRQFCALRSESISMQLANGATTSNMNYVDASDLTLSDMGSMGGMGGFGGGMPGRDANQKNFGERESSDGMNSTQTYTDRNTSSGLNIQGTYAAGGRPQNGNMPEGFDPSQMGGFAGNMPEGFDPSQMGGTFPGGSSSEPEESTASDNKNNTDTAGDRNRPSGGNMQFPGGDFNFNGNGMGNTVSGNANWIWLVVSVLVLVAGLIVAKLYKRY